jgi:hypothetical protein
MRKFLIALVAACWSVYANAVPLVVTNEGVVGQTTVFKASLTGISSISNGIVIDSNSGLGGSPGVFSGFDLDFVWLDVDGNFATTGDRVFASSYSFTTGTVRPTTDPNFQPTAARPGPTFGSTAANSIDAGLATLSTLDAFFSVPSTSTSFGFLTLGDGGSLAFAFDPAVALGPNSALFLGEVGNSPGEFVSANVSINVPEPGSLLLLGLGILGLALVRRQRA